jgi:PAS domain S-box-containing protein
MGEECTGPINLDNVKSKYKLLFECALDMIFLVDINGNILDANNTAVKGYGYSCDELLSMNAKDLRIPIERGSAEKQFREAFEKGAVYETAHMRKDGSEFPVEISSRGLILNNKKVLLAVVRDVTKRKEAERDLSRIAAIVESSDDAILGLTLDGIITDWNPSAEKMYGYTAKEIMGLSVDILIPRDPPGELSRIIDVVKRGSRIEHYDTIRIRKDGKPVHVSLNVSPIISPAGEIIGISWTARDITERIKVEEALRASEKRFRSIYEQAPIGIALIDSITGRFLQINPKYVEIIGRTEEEMKRTTFMAISHPDDLQEDLDNMARLLAGEIKSFNMKKRLFHGDGSIIWVNLIVVPLWEDSKREYPKVHIAMLEDITKQKQAEEKIAYVASFPELNPNPVVEIDDKGTIIYSNPAANHIFPDLVSNGVGHPIFKGVTIGKGVSGLDGENKLVDEVLVDGAYYMRTILYMPDTRRTRIYATDITERKKIEDALEKAKAQAEIYLDLMGHDINNMNQIAMGFLEIALESFHLADEEREFLKKPMETLRNSAKLIENVRKLQKLAEGSLKYRKTDLCDTLLEVKADHSHIPGRCVAINLKSIPHCYVIANEFIKDVFSNLVGNAIKHSDPHKPLTIDIGLECVTEKGKDYYKVIIEDNGPGITDNLKHRLFMRFHRGDAKARGKGLGLYLVMTLVRDFRGRIWVEDRVPGDHTKGARFVVMLPALE